MSLYDEASLIITPNAYKENKLYALKPTDGSGDLTWTRASTKTRVNPDGLVDNLPYNLVAYSEQLENAAWAKISSTISSNSIASPDGTLTADKLIENVANNQHRIDQTTASIIGNNTFAVYAKKGERDSIWLRVGTSGAYFDLTNGTISGISGVTASIQSLPNGWYRCTIVRTSTGANEIVRINLAIGTNNNYLGDGTSGVYIWGAQLNTGTTAKPYFPTTDRLDIPSIDYTDGGCPSILVEPQRTNLLRQSSSFDSASWIKAASAVNVTANTAISPSGVQDADTIETILSGSRFLYQIPTVTAGAITASVFAKKGTSDWLYLNIVDGSNNGGYTFNVNTGVVGQAFIGGVTPTASIVDCGNGWYRCIVNVAIAGTTPQIRFHVASSSSSVSTVAGQNIYLWGAQLEAGSYPTSYIPTVASTVTRVADTASKTGISSLIGQTEGVFYIEAKASTNQNYGRVISLSDGTNANKISLEYYFSDPNLIVARIVSSNVQQAFMVTPSIYPQNINHKIAIKYKLNDCSLFIDGIKVAFDTSALLPIGMSNLFFSDGNGASSRFEGAIKYLGLYKTALTDAQLIQLTTL